MGLFLVVSLMFRGVATIEEANSPVQTGLLPCLLK